MIVFITITIISILIHLLFLRLNIKIDYKKDKHLFIWFTNIYNNRKYIIIMNK